MPSLDVEVFYKDLQGIFTHLTYIKLIVISHIDQKSFSYYICNRFLLTVNKYDINKNSNS